LNKPEITPPPNSNHFPDGTCLAQLARSDGSAIEVKTKASILPVNKRPRLAVKIASSN